MPTELLTTNQLAERLQVNPETIYRWRKEGMPFINLGPKTFRYDVEQVVKWRMEKMEKQN